MPQSKDGNEWESQDAAEAWDELRAETEEQIQMEQAAIEAYLAGELNHETS